MLGTCLGRHCAVLEIEEVETHVFILVVRKFVFDNTVFCQ